MRWIWWNDGWWWVRGHILHGRGDRNFRVVASHGRNRQKETNSRREETGTRCFIQRIKHEGRSDENDEPSKKGRWIGEEKGLRRINSPELEQKLGQIEDGSELNEWEMEIWGKWGKTPKRNALKKSAEENNTAQIEGKPADVAKIEWKKMD